MCSYCRQAIERKLPHCHVFDKLIEEPDFTDADLDKILDDLLDVRRKRHNDN
jgi:hypothetical protein